MFTPFSYRALVLKFDWDKAAQDASSGLKPSTYDGDSAWLLIDKGNREYLNANCRFFGINTPEMNSSDDVERDKAKQARDFLRGLIDGKEVFIKSEKLDKYGRPLVLMWTTQEAFGDPKKSVNYEMVKAGFSKPYYDEGMFSE